MRRCSFVLVLLGLFIAQPCRADGRTDLADTTTNKALSESAQAETSTIARCVAEHERARISRIAEHWEQARASMILCSAETCPLGIRSDCHSWLDELARNWPTLLVVVERGDDGRSPVKLDLDGQEVELRDPAQSIELLPGSHHLRFSLAPYPDVEQEVSLSLGEKNRLVKVRFAREVQSAPVVAKAPVAPRPSPPTRPIPVSSYVYGGGALVAFATSTVLLLSALSLRADARETCAPVCRSEVRRSIESRLLFADISGLAGLTLTGLSIYTWATRPVVFATVTASPSTRSLTFALTGSF